MHSVFRSVSNRNDLLRPQPPLHPRDTAGVALVETTLILWVLVFLLTSAYDIGRMIHQYVMLSQASHEGARSASMVAGLNEAVEFNRAPTDHELVVCNDEMDILSRDPTLPCALILGQLRVRHLLFLDRTESLLEDIEIAFRYDEDGTILARASGRYPAYIPLYRLIPVTAEVRLPYLSLGPPPERKS